ncbi:hypothetical protein K2173_018776 [Erythroxylum novogranatense]|uniref:Transmembrane protein n=1 Tax=Erythroxylum novogranatense TaxID=1862640 RepID=A0AAV8T3G0_9ROSI|nr:hypothetical protein K2173_018776 [Erythroxylum novogranatense]
MAVPFPCATLCPPPPNHPGELIPLKLVRKMSIAQATSTPAVLCTSYCIQSRPSVRRPIILRQNVPCKINTIICHAGRRKFTTNIGVSSDQNSTNKVIQTALWIAEGIYVVWLFLLPYAPGDPVWAISSQTLNSLLSLSLNFFFILPFSNSVGIHLLEAPVLHPVSEGLFNFVIGWTFMFAPMLFTDCKRDRYKWSLDILWGAQMFLTNTFLIPYMAIRLNEADKDDTPTKPSPLATVMTNGASICGLIGGVVCLISVLWALFGRIDGGFGNISDRWEFLLSYLGSERLAYAFIWDIGFYIVFQPWLIGDNLHIVEKSKVVIVNYLRFVPVIGLVAYLFCLNPNSPRDQN